MNKILAKRYAFCDFSKIVGFPNPVPSRDEWEGILPTFKGADWEVPAEHLLDFHEFVHEHQIVHEDVKIKLFRYSLKGAALDWCRSLPASSIHSLASFHYAFHLFCKDEFPAESLFEDCCDEFEKHVQQEVVFSSVCQDENYVVKEDLHDTNDYNGNYIVVDASDLISVAPAAFDLHEETVREEDFSELFQEVAYDMFSPVIGEKDLKIACLSLQDTEVFCSPIFDKYADGEEHISTSNNVDLSSSQPIYDIYESDFDEPFSLPIKEQHHVVINHSMLAEDIEYDEFNLAEDFRSSLLFITPHEQKIEITYEEDIEKEGISSPISSQLFSDLQEPVHGSYILEVEEILEQQAEVTVFGYQSISSFYDPVAIYMEMFFTEVFSCEIFGIKVDGDCKYVLQVEILLHIMMFSLNFICMQRILVISPMLSWLHWKHDVT
jgi:hypothetical protein